MYVDDTITNSVDESSLLRSDPEEKLNLDKQDSIVLDSTLTSPETIIQVPSKAYTDGSQKENEQSRRDLGMDIFDEPSDLVKNNEDSNLNDNKLTNLDSVTVNREPDSYNEVANKKYIDEELDKNTILRFNQTLQNYLKVSVGNDTYILTKYNEIQSTDTTFIQNGNSGGYLLPGLRIFCNDRSNNAKISILIQATKTNPPTDDSGATHLFLIMTALMYIEPSSKNNGENVFVSFERIDIIQICNITFYCN